MHIIIVVCRWFVSAHFRQRRAAQTACHNREEGLELRPLFLLNLVRHSADSGLKDCESYGIQK
jgi:hypothetical protein